MDSSNPRTDPTGLLAHLGWVERLARALVRDVAEAEDLAQEALRVTLEQPRGRVGAGSMKAWLGGVLRRLALDRSRADRSRAAREQSITPRDPPAEPFEIVARAARQQRVAQAVHELPEPARSTVLYRYLDELPTREVAARMGVTEELVRKRLERALAELRRRLDGEFGADTKNWAVALFALPTGVAAVTVKTKLVLAAALVVGAAVTWRVVVQSSPTPPSFPPVAESTASAAAVERSDPVETPDVAPVAPARNEEPRVEEPALLGKSVIPIAVVDPEGTPCTEGRIFGFWRASIGNASPLRSFDQEIEGEITRLVLPPSAVNLLIAASVPDLAPSSRQGMTDHAAEDPEVAQRGHVWTTRTLVVGQPLPTPILAGRIRVDGTPRIPRGLAIACEDGMNEHQVRVHSQESRYEVGPRPGDGARLWVTSEETVPRQVDVDGDDAELDLELATARTLVLTVLDRATGRPLPGVELHARLNAKLGKLSLFRELWRDHSHFFTTDEKGIGRVTGIPLDGTLEIRRDASAVPTEMKIDGQAFQTMRMREPLLDLRLTRDLGNPIERTISVDAEDRRAAIRGTVAEALLASREGDPPLEVHWSIVGEDGRAGVSDESLDPDAKGAFSIEVDRHHDYRVWCEREAIRFSEIADVRVEADDPPPIELSPREGGEVVLRFVRCPPEGFIHLYLPDDGGLAPRGSSFASTGGTIERRVPVAGPARIQVSWVRQRGEKSGQIQTIDVDPASMPVVEIDLKSDLARALTLDLGGVEMPAQSLLWLLPLGKGPDFAGRVSAQLRGREASAPVVVLPGRHLAVLLGAPGLVAGVVEIPAGSRNAPLELHLKVEEHARATLGLGVRLDRIGDVELDETMKKAITLRFADHPELADAATILLPADASFTLLRE
jgi:RNA polymerase sigma-70 factor (ECF subfamily)